MLRFFNNVCTIENPKYVEDLILQVYWYLCLPSTVSMTIVDCLNEKLEFLESCKDLAGTCPSTGHVPPERKKKKSVSNAESYAS